MTGAEADSVGQSASTDSNSRTALSRVSFGTSRALPDHIVARRTGNVLIKHTILKSDHFPGCQNKKLLPLIEGAPNFRQVPELPVYGVAIPTVSGMRLVLDELGAAQGDDPQPASCCPSAIARGSIYTFLLVQAREE
ncbi:hypothetical protein ABBQ32_003847 [Trebouxia sp. C0010 RCD-2024]